MQYELTHAIHNWWQVKRRRWLFIISFVDWINESNIYWSCRCTPKVKYLLSLFFWILRLNGWKSTILLNIFLTRIRVTIFSRVLMDKQGNLCSKQGTFRLDYFRKSFVLVLFQEDIGVFPILLNSLTNWVNLATKL